MALSLLHYPSRSCKQISSRITTSKPFIGSLKLAACGLGGFILVPVVYHSLIARSPSYPKQPKTEPTQHPIAYVVYIDECGPILPVNS